ncbi:GNAT family N-acetyltransferase [Aquimarina aggregata]|uniref:GNAT family N-acetyltransferase n=1 Tax=Aquimarina aggregata TaxID=1642818 RepID=UPI0024922F25|nr:GNAT family N-acetyltransferase [Aquimarina aggregata]
MKCIRLTNISDNYFKLAWELYQKAFPSEEQRLLDAQALVMKKSNYHFEIIIEEKEFVGFLLWWDFETYKYIDHFAIAMQRRNLGLGKLILEKFIDTTDKPILLEVELPSSTINQRRIKFYEKIGFKLNQHYYEIPPLIEEQSSLQLLLMSYPEIISKKDVEEFIKICHPIMFKN